MATSVRDITTEAREYREWDGHHVYEARDPESGLVAFIAIHSTALGPALGGCRMLPYRSRRQAIRDVLRLSRGMTYKAAFAELALGGGKAVIMGDPKKKKTPELLRAMGKFIASFGGNYISGEDMNITREDCVVMREVTEYVGGTDHDPSPTTAFGVIAAANTADFFLGHASCMLPTCVAIAGLGKVGMPIVKRLSRVGCKVCVADTNDERVRYAVEHFGAVSVPVEEIHRHGKDGWYIPCGPGAVLNAKTIPELVCEIVVGSANNQPKTARDVRRMHERGVLYVPDYVANCGGLVDIVLRLQGKTDEEIHAHVLHVTHNKLARVLDTAKEENLPPAIIADRMAEERFQKR